MNRTTRLLALALLPLLVAAAPRDDTKRPATPADQVAAKAIAEQRPGYPLDVCIVGGGKLGSMGDPVDYLHEGRLVRFCCAGCIAGFEKDPAKFIAALDAKILAMQKPHYPMKTCLVGGGELGSMGEPVEYYDGNRLVRFCCKGCVPRYEADRAKYRKLLDQAYLEQQKAAYPLATCVVSKEPLDAMGGPVDFIAGGRLVRLCCKGCVKEFSAHPEKFIGSVDEAWKKKHAPAGTGS